MEVTDMKKMLCVFVATFLVYAAVPIRDAACG